ncbi:ATP-binding cassette domain-containing protein [Streptomyces sp. NPDC052301]|uniref:ATP-binding cassette domain-containing protein n=1 Tax=Streptomyces sp. NPDC052301 TaxID=3365687 RepID=UPI0037D81318
MSTDPHRRPRRRLVRVPFRQQLEEADCGAACLAMVLAAHGRHVPLPELRRTCGVSRDGLTAAALVRGARQYRLLGRGRRLTLSEHGAADAVSALDLPAVAYMRGAHFVVLEGATRSGRIVFSDPAAGRTAVSPRDFVSSFAGVVLTFTPADDFTRSGRPTGLRHVLPVWFRGNRLLVLLAAAAGLVCTVLSVLGVFRVRAALSGAATAASAHTVWHDALGLLALAAGAGLFAWIRHRLLSHVLWRMSLQRSRDFVASMLSLPGLFFQRRFTAGLAVRAQLSDAVAMQLTRGLLAAALDTAGACAFGAVMVGLSPALAATAVAGSLVSWCLMRWAARRIAPLEHRLMAERQSRDGITLTALTMLENLKAEGTSGRAFGDWASSQAQGVDLQHRVDALAARFRAAATTVESLAQLAMVTTGVAWVADGRLAFTDFMALIAVVGAFLASAGGVTRAGLDLSRLRSSLALLEDVLGAEPARPEAPAAQTVPAPVSPQAQTAQTAQTVAVPGVSPQAPAVRTAPAHPPYRAAPAGALELRDVTFGYDVNRTPLIEGASMRIEAGRRIAVVGSTGSGKSTLARLLIGALRPWSGQVLLDGRDIAGLDREELTRSLAYVSQHPWLFEGSVTENITLGDPRISPQDVDRALREACLDTVVARRGGPDAAQVRQDGRNFSGGERQRLVLARALARRPAILVLDEATSAMEAQLEQEVDARLRQRGSTVVVIAHRLSTIRAADLVLVMDGGHVAQVGSHDELVTLSGPYRRLLREVAA